MSTMTTTPVPSAGRTTLVIGLATVAVVAVGAITVPRLTQHQTTSPAHTAAVQAAPRAGGVDVLENRASAGLTAAQQEQLGRSLRTEYQDLMAAKKAAALVAATGITPSVASEQIGGRHGSYAYSQATPTPAPSPTRHYHRVRVLD